MKSPQQINRSMVIPCLASFLAGGPGLFLGIGPGLQCTGYYRMIGTKRFLVFLGFAVTVYIDYDYYDECGTNRRTQMYFFALLLHSSSSMPACDKRTP